MNAQQHIHVYNQQKLAMDMDVEHKSTKLNHNLPPSKLNQMASEATIGNNVSILAKSLAKRDL